MKLKCFVIMPFGNPKTEPERARVLELIYSQWIKPTVEGVCAASCGDVTIECHRADKSVRPGEIITHVIDQLVNADIVVADLSGKNANVFYELGVRHAVRNNTILIAQDIDDIPFDLRHLRAIEYRYEPEKMLGFKDELTAAIQMVLGEVDQIDNPVRRFLCDKAMRDLVSNAVPPGFDAVRSIVTDLIALRKEFEQYAEHTRHIMESLTSTTHTQTETLKNNKINIQQFEGIWKSSVGGTICVRVVDGRLCMPYCYSGSSNLTGHYYDCSLVGDTLVGKFRWFSSSISGYAFFRLISATRAEGGWWYAEAVPKHVKMDISRLNAAISGMEPVTLLKQQGKSAFPRWAEYYFKKKLYDSPM